MDDNLATELRNIRDELDRIHKRLQAIDPKDVKTAGGLAASEETMKYAISQVNNALTAISNIC